ncbi:MAG: type II toxin-antitoxin system HipA family toxin [Cytophagales bacterium]|nr:MAG: type II toxin-antitoxin system HipA family toxin [Cytophagales bacterium]
MKPIKKIVVSIQLDAEAMEVGELVSNDRLLYFKFYPSFVKTGLEISPLKLKLNADINKANELPFEGLFGVFADSLPDGWGKLLLDKTLAARGIAISDLTPLDRLAYIGSQGMGALMYKPEMSIENADEFKMELDEIAKATKQIIAGTATEVLDELFKLGGSSGGARPKILVGYHPITQHIIPAEKVLPPPYEHWLIKFPASSDSVDIANIEYAYYKMAIDAGIEMSDCRLFEGKSGNTYFGTKRFDRQGNNRLHLHSAAGMMHDNFRLSSLDYGHLMDCAFQLERDVKAYEKVLRLAAFNVFANNRDDHSKNFSFLMDAKGKWRLAPAYDLTFSYSGHGMHSTMVAGESAKPNRTHLMKLATYFNVKNANVLIDEVQNAVNNWKKYAALYGVKTVSKNTIQKVIGL